MKLKNQSYAPKWEQRGRKKEERFEVSMAKPI
jgi:hypothetical protein